MNAPLRETRGAGERAGALSFGILDWMAVSDERTARSHWLDWAGATSDPMNGLPENRGAAVPAQLKRRLRSGGLLAAQAFYGLGEVPQDTRIIIASRHGEFGRNVKLLHQLAEGEPLSPTDFSLSVHNAMAGLLSIATGNRAGHTAVSAGADSFAAGLLEALMVLGADAGKRVLLLYYDEPLPELYAPFRDPTERPFGLALLLAQPQDCQSAYALQIQPRRRDAPRQEMQAMAFLRFFLGGAMQLRMAAERNLYAIERTPCAA